MIGSKPREFTGTHMVMLVGAFFGTIISVNLLLAYFAVDTWTGLVVKNSYVASQHFNEQLADGRRMKDLGWSGKVGVNDGKLQFRLSQHDSTALVGAEVTAKLMRPTHESEDHTVTLKEHAPGLYQVMVKLAPGAWDVDVNAKDVQNRKFRNIYRVTISEGG